MGDFLQPDGGAPFAFDSLSQSQSQPFAFDTAGDDESQSQIRFVDDDFGGDGLAEGASQCSQSTALAFVDDDEGGVLCAVAEQWITRTHLLEHMRIQR